MTPQQKAFLNDKLHLLLADTTCPVCGNYKWHVDDSLVHTPLSRVQKPDESTGPAHVLVSCGKCHYEMFFHAGHMGILDV